MELWQPTGAEPLDGQVVLVAEGETDALRLYQELAEAGHVDRYRVVAVPGVQAWTNKMAEQLRQAERVLVFFDNDPPETGAGYTRTQVDQAWGRMRRALGAKVHRVDLRPSGCKDLCEFFARFTLSDMKGLVERGPDYHYATMDVQSWSPVEVDWLIHRLIAKGDRVMMIGDPGAGKSWLAMALSVAIAEAGAGRDSRWLGMRPGSRPVASCTSTRRTRSPRSTGGCSCSV